MHLYYGGAKDCDHWHAGAGFVTSHIALSLMFEQSLQAINPSIALPYWDFTIEGTYFDWTNFRSSSVFSDDWFGHAAPKTAIKTPERGRFAFVPAMLNATEYSELHNAYGMLRAPWNNDGNPFLTRHDHELGFPNNRKPSGCREYRDALLEDNWMDLTLSLNVGAHGHLHEILGGTWSKEATAYANKKLNNLQKFSHQRTPLQRKLWRAGYVDGPAVCDLSQPWEECKCICLSAAFDGKSPAEILQDSGVLDTGGFYDSNSTFIDTLSDEQGNAYEAIPGYSKNETDIIYANMLRALCIPVKTGTHFDATSTNDPTFWMIHPTFDRLWHLNRLEDNPAFDQTWPTDDTVCYGHNPGDVQPFHDLFLPADPAAADTRLPLGIEVAVEEQKHYYTNQELYTQLKPDEMTSPYIYEHFEWVHCEEQGIFIRGPHLSWEIRN